MLKFSKKLIDICFILNIIYIKQRRFGLNPERHFFGVVGMKNHIIVTIAREFGAEGHEIGKLLAERLGIHLYDKDILGRAAKESGIALETLTSSDEMASNRFLEPYLSYGIASYNVNDVLFQAEKRVIHDVATRESCIIVGRMADYILKDEPDCLKVFVYAPVTERINIIKEKHQISEDAAKKLVHKMDAARSNYYAYYSHKKWKQNEGKDIILNRATFGVAGCVDILEAMVQTRER